MKELFSLGDIYPSDFIRPNETCHCAPVELNLIMDNAGLVRLANSAPQHILWGDKYWYRSSTNNSMKKHLKNIVDSISNVRTILEGDIWIDIASNDGYLLSCVPPYVTRIGIDPAGNSYQLECSRHANIVIPDYFSADIFIRSEYGNRKANIITSIAMFYDVDKPDMFIKDVAKILDNDGLWVLQLSYTPLMLQQLAFDNICHEHKYYYSLFNLKKLLNDNGFQIMDCELNNCNGGSFRVYAMKHNADVKKFASQTNRDVGNYRVNSLLEYEKTLKLDDKNTWRVFFNEINNLKMQVVQFITQEKEKGKLIWAYAASTKGNTLLQYFGLDNNLITGIADCDTNKWGLKTIGTNIPIYSEREMREARPDYLLILAWHYLSEFMDREKEYRNSGGRFIVPCSKFQII